MLSRHVSAKVAALAVAAALLSSPVAQAQDWPGRKWNEKLTQDYQQWKPVKDVLQEFAQRAGAPPIVCPDNKDRVLMVPMPAGLTLKEAFGKAAEMCGYDVTLEGGKLAVKQGNHIGDWLTLMGGQAKAVRFGEVQGDLCLPRGYKPDGPLPWVWYAPSQGLGVCNAWTVKRLFAAGIAFAYVGVGESQGNPKGRQIYQAFYEKLVKDYGCAKKAVLLPQSRGGLMLYNWAVEHPDEVQAIGGIYPVCDLRSYPGLKRAAEAYGLTPEQLEAQLAKNNPIDRIAPLAKARVPIFHVHGDHDSTVPLDKNSGELIKRYKALGGQAELLVIPNKGHEAAPEYFQCQELADFLVKQAKASVRPAPPAPAKV